jgi:hypothetical protein
MAVADAKYQFTLVDVGACGRQADGGVFANSVFGRKLLDGTLEIPSEVSQLPESRIECPYVFVGDQAFALKKHLMVPFRGTTPPREQLIFNYRLSRARRIIENAFGIMAARWRIFRQTIIADPEYADVIVKATVALHNYLIKSDLDSGRRTYAPTTLVDGESNDHDRIRGKWRDITDGDKEFEEPDESLDDIAPSKVGREVQQRFMQYFQSPEGRVHWQDRKVDDGDF